MPAAKCRHTSADLHFSGGWLGNDGVSYAYSFATGVNNHDEVVGYSPVPGATDGHAFLWSNGTMIDLTPDLTPGAYDQSGANGIDDAGEIIGAGGPSLGGEQVLGGLIR